MVYVPASFISEYPSARKHSVFSRAGWWLNKWPTLAWIETFVKIAAWLWVPAAIAPARQGVTGVHSAERLIQTLIMGAASLLLAMAIVDRLLYREIISMIFVFPNNVAHWAVFYALVRGAVDTYAYRYFLCLMLTGDVVKLVFFVVHGFEIKLVLKSVLYFLVALFAAMYAACLLFEFGHYRPEMLKAHAFLLKKMPEAMKYLQQS